MADQRRLRNAELVHEIVEQLDLILEAVSIDLFA
jgi:hypothetical protein